MSDAGGSRLGGSRGALAVLGIGLLATAGLLGLFESTETRYAEIAREMLASGDWLTPRLNGILHLHKPPLAYWAAAAGMGVVGPNEWGARIPVALASIVSLACVARIAARRFGALGIPPVRAMWVLGSSALFLALGRSLASDPFLTAAVLLYWALAPSPWALAALGLGFLAKGPVVLVHTALPVLAAALWGRDRRTLALLGPGRGWLLFLGLALPWFLILAVRIPGLVDYLLRDQILGRYASTVHQRGGPPWYFVAVAILGVLPWTAALFPGIARAWRARSSPDARLLLCWLAAPIAFLSFSGSKLPAYLLPSLPAAALLAAWALDGAVARRAAAVTLLALAVAGFVAGPPALARLASGAAGASAATALPPAANAGLALLALAAIAVWLARIGTGAALVTAALVAMIVAAAPYESTLGSPRRIARLLTEQRAGEPVFEVGGFNSGLPFYLREKVGLVEVPREIQFDLRAGAHPETSPDSLAAAARAHGRVWIFGREALAEGIARGQGLEWVRVARWRKDALGFLTH